MKKENTLENKAKFFAQHFQQTVLRSINEPEIKRVATWTMNNPTKNEYLQLTSLSQVTDEDAIEVSDIIGLSKTEYLLNALSLGSRYVMNSVDVQVVVDLLRSKSYALPWMDLSIEDLIEYGWVKLK